MTTNTLALNDLAGSRRAPAPKLTFLRTVRSEWIKLTSVRSSIVLLATTVEVMAGIGVLNAWGISTVGEGLAKVGCAEELGVMARGVPASGIAVAQMLIASWLSCRSAPNSATA